MDQFGTESPELISKLFACLARAGEMARGEWRERWMAALDDPVPGIELHQCCGAVDDEHSII
jgi:hypothetical protein